MDHVTTQLPYAATVATASAVGYIVVGFTESGLAGFVTTAVVLVALVFIVKNVKHKREKRKGVPCGTPFFVFIVKIRVMD